MMRLSAALAAATLAWAAPAAHAHEFYYQVDLAGVAGSAANGSAQLLLDLDLVTLDLDANFTGLSGPSTSVHIHCCTAVPFAGDALRASAPAAPPGFTPGLLHGSFAVSFDLTDPATYDPGFVAAHGPLLSDALNALIFGLADGRAYLTIGSSAQPAGELRGALVPVAAPVPEPATALLGLAGLAGLALAASRRR